jgi:hypothetical protein
LASLTTTGNQQTLSFGVSATFYFSVSSTNDTIMTVSGTLVATHTNTATATPTTIQIPTVTNNVVTLNWQGTAGQFFQVLSSSNLQTWQSSASNLTSATTNYTWTGTNPATKGFYRITQ